MFDLNELKLKLATILEYFDESWYVATYPDVKMTGIKPLEHFLRYGSVMLRDPGPNFSSKYYLNTRKRRVDGINSYLLAEMLLKDIGLIDENRVILAAYELCKIGKYEQAIRFANRDLPSKLKYTLEVLKANAALAKGLEFEWLGYLNNYLRFYKAGPIILNGGGSLFSRITASCDNKITNGPLVSIIMPVYNSEKTFIPAAQSILNQTWSNLELIVIDDASTDGTWSLCQKLADKNSNVKIYKNKINYGPYVSKNIALRYVEGVYITCHDADDWAFPNRIEQQASILLKNPKEIKATTGAMLRIEENGMFSRLQEIGENSEDGVLRRCFVSLFIEKQFFDKHFGSWDNVRIGADSELIARINMSFPAKIIHDNACLMLCLDHVNSLTRDRDTGISDNYGLSSIRKDYQLSWKKWHIESKDNLFIKPFPSTRVFPAPEKITVYCNEASFLSDAGYLLPEPIEGEILLQAFNLAESGHGDASILFFEKNEKSENKNAGYILKANNSIHDDFMWTSYVNEYLSKLGLQYISLEKEGSNRFIKVTSKLSYKIKGGPLVTVIIPAFNSDKTIEHSVNSILNQTWSNLEVIIVDDCSSDETWERMLVLSKSDSRIKLLKNNVNVGPYVSKNYAVDLSSGDYITGHDADDWSHPQRIENHLKYMLSNPNVKASVGKKVRLNYDGKFTYFSKVKAPGEDGVITPAFISCMFEGEFFRKNIGHWDSVRFGADGEIMNRIKMLIGDDFKILNQLTMFCLDSDESLTNHPDHGISKNTGLSPARKTYLRNYKEWHKSIDKGNCYLKFPKEQRDFSVHEASSVSYQDIMKNISSS